MLSNKHIIIALLVTPVLAILAWFSVGALVGEKAHQAEAGRSYPLVERSNCRYDSGQCDLRNEDLRLSIRFDAAIDGPQLLLQASHSLDGALLAVAGADDKVPPQPMLMKDSRGQHWVLSLSRMPLPTERLRLVVQSGGSQWFADASTAFLERYREQAASD